MKLIRPWGLVLGATVMWLFNVDIIHAKSLLNNTRFIFLQNQLQLKIKHSVIE